jgi:hypothetical protein
MDSACASCSRQDEEGRHVRSLSRFAFACTFTFTFTSKLQWRRWSSLHLHLHLHIQIQPHPLNIPSSLINSWSLPLTDLLDLFFSLTVSSPFDHTPSTLSLFLLYCAPSSFVCQKPSLTLLDTRANLTQPYNPNPLSLVILPRSYWLSNPHHETHNRGLPTRSALWTLRGRPFAFQTNSRASRYSSSLTQSLIVFNSQVDMFPRDYLADYCHHRDCH